MLVGIEQRLERLPRVENLVEEGAEVGLVAVEVFIGIFFVLATAAYWIYERKRAEELVCRLVPRKHAKTVGVAVAAGVAVLLVRLLEDYVVIPRVLGEAVGLSPLIVLVSVAGSAVLFGEFAVLLAIPLAAVVATLVDVIVLNKDPAEEEVPTVLFPAKDGETTG